MIFNKLPENISNNKISLFIFFLYLVVAFPPIFSVYFNLEEGIYETTSNYFYSASIPIKIICIFFIFNNNVIIKLNKYFNFNVISKFIYYILITSIFSINFQQSFMATANLLMLYYLLFNIISKNIFYSAIRLIVLYFSALIFLSILLYFINNDVVFACDINCNNKNFKGLFMNKNGLGITSALIFLYLINLKNNLKFKSNFYFFLVINSFFGLILSKSITPLLAMVPAVYVYYHIANNKSFIFFLKIIVFLILTTSFLSVIFNIDLILFFLDTVEKDATGGGRTDIVKVLLGSGLLLNFFGNGFNTSVSFLSRVFGEGVLPAVDNTWVATILDLGLIYTFIYFYWMLRQIYKGISIKSMRLNNLTKTSFFIFLLVYSFGETGVTPSMSLTFLTLLVALVTSPLPVKVLDAKV